MTDYELLELAAKAAGVDTKLINENGHVWCNNGDQSGYWGRAWNPLTNDDDALRLAVKLGISITPCPVYSTEHHSFICKQHRKSDTMRDENPTEVIELYGNDPCAAMRRAIVRVAAAIGEQMK